MHRSWGGIKGALSQDEQPIDFLIRSFLKQRVTILFMIYIEVF
jgi:hypothetical protein